MTLSTVLSALFLAVFGIMVAVSFSFPEGARFMPLVVGVPGMVLCIVQLVTDLRARPVTPSPDAELGRHTLWSEARAWGWLVGFIGLVLLIGFNFAGPILVFGYLWLEAQVRPSRAAIAAAIFGGWIWFMFDRVLGFALHPGLFGQGLMSAIGI